jgi:hypothetical protein
VGLDPYSLVSEQVLFSYLTGLTAIQPFRGWRTAAGSGESEALDYVEGQLAAMRGLAGFGLELERRDFHIFSGIELRDSRVQLVIDGVQTEVPGFAVSGPRDDLESALRFDSDGQVNDLEPDPVVVSGPVTVVLWNDDLFALPDLTGRVVLLDYALVDRVINDREVAEAHAEEIVDRNPAAIVPICRYSNVNGESHGTFAADLPIWSSLDGPLPPILNIRIEDLAELGIGDWSDLGIVDSVQVTWDADVTSPGLSGNLMALIPGADRSQAVIIGAHIDSPNSPGAADDGSGSVALLQVAWALDAARYRPPVDLALVWFGSEERGLYGSSVFAASHSELLDRTLAMLQVDCLSVPVDGYDARLIFSTWTYEAFGDDRPTCPDYLSAEAARHGISSSAYSSYSGGSDHFNFTGWDVPNAHLGNSDPFDPTQVHYANHWHDPYDTVELVRSEADNFVRIATIALATGLQTGHDRPLLRVTPAPNRRAVFVGSHTEGAHMTPAQLIWFGMTLAWHGFDVDMVPYGHAVTAADLTGADLVVVLPVHDYPFAGSGIDQYDEAWTTAEVDAIEEYTRNGGLLVLTNSAHRLKSFNTMLEINEDASDMNRLANRFAIDFDGDATIPWTAAGVTSTHPLVNGLAQLAMIRGNGVPFTTTGQVLAAAGTQAVVTLQPAGAGEVLTVADLGILSDNGSDYMLDNLGFFYNLANYARARR